MSKRASMALCRLAALLLALMVLVAVGAGADADAEQSVQAQARPLLLQQQMLDCGGACWARCGNNWKNEMCNKMCNVCCSKCSCVPPGTGQDTRHLCPCYDTMINPHTGKLKCP